MVIILKVIFLGPPGAGKGTQAKLAAGELQIPHISTGDIFRDNLNKRTELGMRAEHYMNQGRLVPDDVTNNMVKERLSRKDCKNGFILDGYPRTIAQAEFLEEIKEMDKVIDFELDEETSVQRISGRRTCKDCQKSYHITFNPPKKKGKCDVCGGKLIQRDDETPETVRVRLGVYKRKTEPLIKYYRQKGILETIDASPPIEVIHAEVISTLKE